MPLLSRFRLFKKKKKALQLKFIFKLLMSLGCSILKCCIRIKDVPCHILVHTQSWKRSCMVTLGFSLLETSLDQNNQTLCTYPHTPFHYYICLVTLWLVTLVGISTQDTNFNIFITFYHHFCTLRNLHYNYMKREMITLLVTDETKPA